MLLPSLIHRAELLVGMATPTVPLSCAYATDVPNAKPNAIPAASALSAVLRDFKFVSKKGGACIRQSLPQWRRATMIRIRPTFFEYLLKHLVYDISNSGKPVISHFLAWASPGNSGHFASIQVQPASTMNSCAVH